MMKYVFSIACILSLLTFNSFGQETLETNPRDSIELDKIFKNIMEGIAAKDTNTLHSLSLKIVDCGYCKSIHEMSSEHDTYVPIDTLLNMIFRDFNSTEHWAAIKTKNYSILTRNIKNFQPPNLNLKKGDDLIIYELWFVTMEPNKIPGYEGHSHAFQFVKVDGLFKWWGFASVP